jgi:hypothetical protein
VALTPTINPPCTHRVNDPSPPVCAVIKFEDEKVIVRQTNDSLYGLAAAVLTQGINRTLETGHKLKAGSVWINCVNTLNTNVLFGGFKQSRSTYYSFSRCPPPNPILITSDLQSVASLSSMTPKQQTATPSQTPTKVSSLARRIHGWSWQAVHFVRMVDPVAVGVLTRPSSL